MEIEEIVLSIEQMQYLNELGLKVKDTALSWVRCNRDRYGNFLENAKWEVKVNPYFFYILTAPEIVKTLTLQEIWHLLPKEIDDGEFMYELVLEDCQVSYYQWESGDIKDFHGKNIMDEAYNMLCWVLENGYLKQDK